MASIATKNEGWSALAEATIKLALRDMESKYSPQHKYFACKFLTNEEQKELFTGLAPHMIRDWERAEIKAKKILETELSGFDPKKEKR